LPAQGRTCGSAHDDPWPWLVPAKRPLTIVWPVPGSTHELGTRSAPSGPAARACTWCQRPSEPRIGGEAIQTCCCDAAVPPCTSSNTARSPTWGHGTWKCAGSPAWPCAEPTPAAETDTMVLARAMAKAMGRRRAGGSFKVAPPRTLGQGR